MIHKEAHPMSGKTVRIKADAHQLGGSEYRLEDWWDRVSGQSWKWATVNPACLGYAMRSIKPKLPNDDEVVYGKIGPLGYLVHVTELDE